MPRAPRSFADDIDIVDIPRPPFARNESPGGLRSELNDLRLEVRRLAAEIDKLWARERGRAASTGVPPRTGTRATRPGVRTARSAAGPPSRSSAAPRSRTAPPAGATRAPGTRGSGPGKRAGGAPKRGGSGPKRGGGGARGGRSSGGARRRSR